MQARLDPWNANSQAMNAMLNLENYLQDSSLEYSICELVRTRASQLNGCAFCLQMHTSDARKAGETEERLYLLNAWREAPVYTPRERAALAWTEALTLVAKTGAPDADYEQARQAFSDRELVDLTLLIGAINSWNRIAIGFRSQPAVTPTGLQSSAV
ncbi:carboxymuconolactone decarboxylase family protein [Parahaliea aestuarii]|uniref:Carboxymuconolactone decarboxylase family protein n=1 Tax=Parahaliea aestuarii TaxID=1852021 RepID=A0A5C8ZQ20_9GAMM|nr:carboxymuconolactone decarboxylase family protein [Parahaliea aestuarii]TXS89597.1 carboxymuconolactone decarboxylase family protein [Parahaliea aestuarii]